MSSIFFPDLGDDEDYGSDAPADQSYTLRVVPKTSNSRPIRGALVSYEPPTASAKSDIVRDTYDGDVPAEFDAVGGEDGPRGKITIRHYGREVGTHVIEQGEAILTGTNTYRLSVETGYNQTPERLEEIDQVGWIDGDLVATWRPPRNRPPQSLQFAMYDPGLLPDDDDRVFERHANDRSADFDGSQDSYSSEKQRRDGWTLQTTHKHFPDQNKIKPKSVLAWTEDGEKRYIIRPSPVYYWGGGNAILRGAGSSPAPPPVDEGGDPEPIDPSMAVDLPVFDQPEDTGSNVTSVDVSPSSGFVEDDAYILTATVSGDGDHDPTVSWSSSNINIIASDGRRALIKATASGSVTATSNGDSSYSTTVDVDPSPYPYNSTPASPSGVGWRSAAPDGTIELFWDKPDNELVFHRIYLSDSQDQVGSSPMGESFGNSIRIGGLQLGKEYFIEVVRVHPDGNEGDRVSLTATPQSVEDQRAGRFVKQMPEITVAPSESADVDLSDFIHLNKTQSANDQTDAWSNANVQAYRTGESSDLSLSQNGSVLTVSSPAGSASDYGPEPILFRVEYAGRRPVWGGFFAGTGSTSDTGVPQVNGISIHQLPDDAGFDPSLLVGGNPSSESLSSWTPSIQQVATLGAVSVDEDGQASISSGHVDDSGPKPVVMAVSGDNGNSLITLYTYDPPATETPLLPTKDLKKAEVGSQYYTIGSVFPEDISPSFSSEWKRVLTGSDELYDVSLLEPPQKVRYQAPTYYRDEWLDSEKFPADASLRPEKGLVEYRAGLEGPSGSQQKPNITDFNVEPGPAAAQVTWTPVLDGQDRPDLSLPVDFYPQGQSGQKRTVYGQSSRQIEDLDPAETYVVDVLGSQSTVDPDRRPLQLKVIGAATAEGKYEYKYELSGPPVSDIDNWKDPFSNSHTSDTASVESNEVLSEHTIVVHWPNESRQVRAETEWRAPASTVEFEKRVRVGRSLPVSAKNAPTFKSRQYSGSRTKTLGYDVYPAGTWTVFPVGRLPLSLDAELQDFVRAVFVGPGGEEMGDTVELGRSSELAVRLQVEAVSGRTPIVYGARVIRTS